MKPHRNKFLKINKQKVFKIKKNQYNKRNQKYGTIYHLILMIRDLPAKINNRLKLKIFNKSLKNYKKIYYPPIKN